MLVELIPKVLAEEEAQTRRSGGWRPRCSSAGTQRCVRKEVYKAHGMPAKPFNGRTLLIFDDGHWHEELTIDKVQKTVYRHHSSQMAVDPVCIPGTHRGYICDMCSPKDAAGTLIPDKIVRVEADMLHGHIDGIITDPMGKDVLFEHKSANHWSWERWMKGGEIPWDYVTQAALYVYGLRQVGSNMTQAILLIKNKNNSAYLEFIIECPTTLQPEPPTRIIEGSYMEGDNAVQIEFLVGTERNNLIGSAIDRFAEVAKHRDANTVPPRPLPMGHWQCNWCEFADLCWEGYITSAKDRMDNPSAEAEGQLGADIVEARELRTRMTTDENRYKDLVKDIKVSMSADEQRRSHVQLEDGSRYNAVLSIRSKKGLDEEFIPEDIINKARTITEYEQLDIRIGKPFKKKAPKKKKAAKKKAGKKKS